MPEDRTITYPADAMQRVADRLQDWDPAGLGGDEARERAFEITTKITEAVDKLRAIEAREEGKVTICRVTADQALAALREWHGSTVLPDVTYERWAERIAEFEDALRDA